MTLELALYEISFFQPHSLQRSKNIHHPGRAADC